MLTHPYLLSAFAYHDNTSPIHRGVFLTRNIVGRALKPPPIAVAFKNDEFAPDLTMREKITQLTSDTNCMACHSVINPLGFALEHYDAVGRWRTSEDEKPVDTKSQYTTENGETVEVDSARDIADMALPSESAHRAFVIQLFEHMTKQIPAVYGPTVIERMRAEFEADHFNIQNLMVRIAVLTCHARQCVTIRSCCKPHRRRRRPNFESLKSQPSPVLARSRSECRHAAVRIGTVQPVGREDVGQGRRQRLVIMFSPNGTLPDEFWPDQFGADVTTAVKADALRTRALSGANAGAQGREQSDPRRR